MTTQYLYTSPFCPGAKVTATYENGQLSELTGLHNIGALWESIPINSPIPFQESEVEKMAALYDYAVVCRKIAFDTNGQKVALFCSQYKKHLGIKYQVRAGEAAKIKDLKVDEAILSAYFMNKEWWGKQPKSIRNFSTNYNAVLQLLNKKEMPKNNFPTEPDLEYQNTIPTSQWPALWKHWRDNGFEPVKSGNRGVTSWRRKAAIVLFVISVLSSGCGLFKAASSVLKNAEMAVPDSIEVAVKMTKEVEVIVPADTAVSDWKYFFGDEPIIFDDPGISVEIIEADSALFWEWFDQQPEDVKPAILKGPKKLLKAKVIVPEKTIKEEVCIENVTVKNPQKGNPLPTGDVEAWGTKEGVIAGICSLILGLLYYFLVGRKKSRLNDQDKAQTES